DGRLLASAGDRTVRLWSVADHRQIGQPLPTDGLAALVFTPDGSRLITADEGAKLSQWDLTAHAPVRQIATGHKEAIGAVALSPNGRTLATGSFDGTIRLWDAETLAPIGPPLTGHKGAVNDVTFSPDGRTVASAGFDTTVRIWRIL